MSIDRGSVHRIVIRGLPLVAGGDGRTVPAGRVVYCVPAAGTGARSFLVPFARSALRGSLRVVQLPGREDRLSDPCMDDILEMADLVAEAIAGEGVEDYALFGHSFGSLVMLETARRLERMSGPAPALLAVAACPAPLPSSTLQLFELEPADLAEELRGYGRLDSGDPLGEELAALVLPALEADCGAVVRYLEGPGREAVTTQILAMSGVLDTSVSPEKMASWRECTQSEFTLWECAGGHFFPLESDLPLQAVAEWKRSPGADVEPG